MRFTNYAKPAGRSRNHERFIWRVFVDESNATLDQIESVEYRLHETFPEPIRLKTNRDAKFALESSGWGEFKIFITVRFKNGTEENTSYDLDLSQSWPHVAQEEDTTRHNLPRPTVGESISQQHVALLSASWRNPERDVEFGHRVYRFDVVVAAADEVLDEIQSVKYFLPPAWPASSSPKTIDDRASRFKLKELAWGDLIVRAEVKLYNQPESISLSCFVRLTESGERL